MANLVPKCITDSQIHCIRELQGSNGKGAFVLPQHADASEAAQQNTGWPRRKEQWKYFGYVQVELNRCLKNEKLLF